MLPTLQQQLEQWHQQDQFQKIVDAILAIPKENWDYELKSHLARAWNNLGEYQKAKELLLQMSGEGKADPLWHFRLGYAYYYLDQLEEALREFDIVLELNPTEEDALLFRNWCRQGLIDQSGHRPVVYTEEQLNLVEEHIERCFGHYPHVFHELVSSDIHVDLCIIEPTPERNYYTVVTLGMGAHLMNVPLELREHKLERAELLVCLPPDWQLQREEEYWYWPLRWLKILARLPAEEDSWLGWGHTIANPQGRPFAENTKFCGVMLVNPGDFPEDAACCPLPDGDEVNFYQMVPLYQEEMDFKMQNGAEELLQRMSDEQLQMVDLARKNACDFMGKKKFFLSKESIQPLLKDWQGPEGCIASDRILVDGCPVGYLYRELPEEKNRTWDSGWRFTAGDESNDYLANPEHTGVYSLNTICNYDPTILLLLQAPYGTVYIRDEKGGFQQESSSPLKN